MRDIDHHRSLPTASCCLIALLGTSAGCAHEQPSAAEHRAQAQRELAKAEKYQARYEATMGGRLVAKVGDTSWIGVTDEADSYYDSGLYALEDAQKHFEHAREHERAAEQLESFEATECHAVSAPVRAACPLAAPATEVVNVDHGVRVRFQPGVDVAAVVQHMRCHLAYARTRGFEQVPACPLYIQGVDIERTADGQGVVITGQSRGVRKEVRRRSREVFVSR
jgi:hypothetical protein